MSGKVVSRQFDAAAAKQGDKWDTRTVRHLYSRAAFRATPAEIEEGVRLGPAASIEKLLTAAAPWKAMEPALVRWEDFDLDPDQVPLTKSKYATPELAHESMARLRTIDRSQFMEYTDRWLRSMIRHDDPLRDKLTLFWHGLFTTSVEVVKRKYEVIQQHQWLRLGALSSFSKLLRGLVHDPAMLQYLDNNTNIKGHPNENFARELMELYSLGEGNYSELDVREAARALTGCTGDPEGNYAFVPEHHDDDEKTILGRKGRFGSDELVEILLAQPVCAIFVARRLITWFEGLEPEPRRLESYARFFRDHGYELKPFLKRLFQDPDFYSEKNVGARVQGPIEYLVGFCRLLGIDPPDLFLYNAAVILGQRFYAPPSVEGWSEGLGWITHDSLLQRGNCTGVLLEVFRSETSSGTEPVPELDSDSRGSMGSEMVTMADASTCATVSALTRLTSRAGWTPNLDLVSTFAAANAKQDREIVAWALSAWLASEPSASTLELLVSYVQGEREAAGIAEGELVERGRQNEMILRRLARMIFSLPEAQLG